MLELTAEAATLVETLRSRANAGEDAMMRIVADRDGGQECLKVTFVDHAMPGERVARSRGITMSVNADLARSLDGKRLEVTWTKRGERLILRLAPPSSRASRA